MGNTSIEWTLWCWNFLRGCSLATMPGPNGKPVLREGCRHCYARDTGGRFCGPGFAYEGLVIIQGGSAHWTGKVDFTEDHLFDPLRKKKPTKIFVNSMSDLFHPNAKREWVDLGFAVMLLCPHHIFQSLTKRPELQRDYINSPETPKRIAAAMRQVVQKNKASASVFNNGINLARMLDEGGPLHAYGIGSHIHLGCSIEDQASADYVLPILYSTTWGMRWVSIEPLLGPINFRSWLNLTCANHHLQPNRDTISCGVDDCNEAFNRSPSLGWGVVGLESGTKARPGDIVWVRDIIRQFKEARLPLFVKQLGARPYSKYDRIGYSGMDTGLSNSLWPDGFYRALKDRKGGDPSEWPADLRIRQFPEVLP